MCYRGLEENQTTKPLDIYTSEPKSLQNRPGRRNLDLQSKKAPKHLTTAFLLKSKEISFPPPGFDPPEPAAVNFLAPKTPKEAQKK